MLPENTGEKTFKVTKWKNIFWLRHPKLFKVFQSHHRNSPNRFRPRAFAFGVDHTSNGLTASISLWYSIGRREIPENQNLLGLKSFDGVSSSIFISCKSFIFRQKSSFLISEETPVVTSEGCLGHLWLLRTGLLMYFWNPKSFRAKCPFFKMAFWIHGVDRNANFHQLLDKKYIWVDS